MFTLHSQEMTDENQMTYTVKKYELYLIWQFIQLHKELEINGGYSLSLPDLQREPTVIWSKFS